MDGSRAADCASVTINHTDMKKQLLTLFLVCATWAMAEVPEDYKEAYATLEGQQGEALFDAISAIAAEGYQAHTYGDLWTYYQTTDVDANGQIWDIYSTCTFIPVTNQCGNYSSVCDCYNREHSVPKSWFGGNEKSAPGNDLFHLYPTDGKVNGQRSNFAYGECANGSSLSEYALGRLGSSTLVGYESVGTVFEPADMYKGDLARSYFGMIVRYGRSYAFNQADGGMTMFSNSDLHIGADNNYGLTDYSVALLMAWHAADTLSEKETQRNTAIQQTQGNRNPFIDCPILADYLWGQKAGQAVALQDLVDCGCADGKAPAAVEGVAFPSLTLTPAEDGVVLTCLPYKAVVAVMTASGQIVQIETVTAPEHHLRLPQGLYLIVVKSGEKQQSFKILRE